MTRFHTSRIVWIAAVAVAAALPATAAVATSAAAATTTYTITNLGSLGGGSGNGLAVNNNGQVTGYSYTSQQIPVDCPPQKYGQPKHCYINPYHAFLYSNGAMTDLGTLGGTNSQGNSVNLSGQVAGQSDTKTGSAAFLWDGKKMINLGALAPLSTGPYSSATGINDAGQVVGWWGLSPVHAWLYSNGTITDLPEPSGEGCQASAINNSGQILGTCAYADNSNRHSVLWQNGTVTDLSTLGGLQGFSASAINNLGQIAGSAPTSTGAVHGFLYSNGTITDLGSFTPAALNDNGVMVGGEDVYSGGTAQNLNNLLQPGSIGGVTNVTAINDNGQIVASEIPQVFLLTPS
jgi:probable HAF family extracellular repeat protein